MIRLRSLKYKQIAMQVRDLCELPFFRKDALEKSCTECFEDPNTPEALWQAYEDLLYRHADLLMEEERKTVADTGADRVVVENLLRKFS